jgi:Methyltransferase domain
VFDESKTLETGAGLSSIVFAMRGCHHTAVAPDAAQAERIKAWCQEHRVSTDRLRFVLEPSETALPAMEPEPLDVVLIDGAHGFPAPFIDWRYAGRRLRVGGTLIIDDTQLWTGAVLRDFLAAEPQWDLVAGSRFEFAVARRASEGSIGEWAEQPYVSRRSFTSQSPSLLHKAVGTGAQISRNARAAGKLLRASQFGKLREKVRTR